MSKSHPGKEEKRSRARTSKLRALVSIAIVLSLVVTALALANWGGSRATTQGGKDKKSGEMTIESFSSTLPSKEYVYAGGRLVATEECGYSISPTSIFKPQNGGAFSVNVTAPAGCNWTVVNVPTWTPLVSGDSGSGNGVVSFETRENFTGTARLATMTIAGLNFSIVQDGGFPNCTYQISPLFANFSSSGGPGSVSVTVDSHCGWQALSNTSWLTITSLEVGIGNGTVSYSVGVNATGSTRTASITIGTQTLNVKQTG